MPQPSRDPQSRDLAGDSVNVGAKVIDRADKVIKQGARLKSLFEEQAKKRQFAALKQNQSPDTVRANLPEREGTGRARDQAAAVVGVSPRLVENLLFGLPNPFPKTRNVIFTRRVFRFGPLC